MFSGIVECTSSVVAAEERRESLYLTIAKPNNFNDLSIGDSIAIDGVCLTLESFTDAQLQFCVGPETKRVTGWTIDGVIDRVVNLERSLRVGERIHGHFVTGHVDVRSRVLRAEVMGETLKLTIEIPDSVREFIWSKGSVALNGVSLTVNAVTPRDFSVGLIPETLRRTNLDRLKAGNWINLEIDNMARGLVHLRTLTQEASSNL